MRGLAHRKDWYPARQSHTQIGNAILQGATSFNMRSGFIKQNGSFEQSQKVKGRKIRKI
jgi:hypothetical protein